MSERLALTIRILTQLNFSAGENPDGDSGLRFTCELIQRLQTKTDLFFFYVLVPKRAADAARKRLACPRTHVVEMDLPPRLHGGDFAFDPSQLVKVFNFSKFDVDIVFLNQPELAPAFSNFLNRQMFHLTPVFSYIHWFDTRRPSTPKNLSHWPGLMATVTGLASSEAAGCNSAYGREKILSVAARWLNTEALARLKNQIHVMAPPISADRIMAGRRDKDAWARPDGKAVVLVNHRLLKYTGVRQLLDERIPKLWDERQDFQLVLTNPSRARLPGSLARQPWATNGTLSDDEYFSRLWSADIVLAPHRATHWSISTLEAVAAECLPICNRESFFVEMFDPVLSMLNDKERALFQNYCLYFRQELPKKIGQAIDARETLKPFRRRLAEATRVHYDWLPQLGPWIDLFVSLYAAIPVLSPRNPTVMKAAALIRREPGLAKDTLTQALRIAPKNRTIPWTSIRKTLADSFVDSPEEAVLRLRPR